MVGSRLFSFFCYFLRHTEREKKTGKRKRGRKRKGEKRGKIKRRKFPLIFTIASAGTTLQRKKCKKEDMGGGKRRGGEKCPGVRCYHTPLSCSWREGKGKGKAYSLQLLSEADRGGLKRRGEEKRVALAGSPFSGPFQ